MTRPAQQRTRIWMSGALVLALTSGLVIGRATKADRAAPPSYLEQLAAELELSDEQVAAIDGILSREDADIDAWLDQSLDGLRGRVSERRDRTEQELLAALDDEQRERYQQLAVPQSR